MSSSVRFLFAAINKLDESYIRNVLSLSMLKMYASGNMSMLLLLLKAFTIESKNFTARNTVFR